MSFCSGIKKSAVYNSVAFVLLSFQSAAVTMKSIMNLWDIGHGEKVGELENETNDMKLKISDGRPEVAMKY